MTTHGRFVSGLPIARRVHELPGNVRESERPRYDSIEIDDLPGPICGRSLLVREGWGRSLDKAANGDVAAA